MRVKARRAGASRKPLVGAVSLSVALALAALAYRATGDPGVSAALAGAPTLIAPAYYAARRRPLLAAAGGVLASMASGGVAWLGLHLVGASPSQPGGFLLALAAGLLTGGVASHLWAASMWAAALEALYKGEVSAAILASGATALGLATSLGLAVMIGVGRGRPPSRVVLALAGLVLALSLLYASLGEGV